MPVLNAMQTKPSDATRAVVITGRNLVMLLEEDIQNIQGRHMYILCIYWTDTKYIIVEQLKNFVANIKKKIKRGISLSPALE
ncbi:MAG: hypothetical protein L3J53_08525 [Proteobacteria bacterium]|nr:hypothetical protein [Pseudomonadota bacterium]